MPGLVIDWRAANGTAAFAQVNGVGVYLVCKTDKGRWRLMLNGSRIGLRDGWDTPELAKERAQKHLAEMMGLREREGDER